MKGGNNFKPQHIKLLEGRKVNSSKPQPRPVFPLQPPAELPDFARQFWAEVVPVLVKAKVLTEADIIAFKVMALTYNTICQAEKCLDEEGLLISGARGNEKVKNPVISVLNQSRQIFRLQLQSFGLDPMSRERLGAVIADENEEIDPMEALLNMKRD